MKKHIRFDWAIKRLIRNKADFGILEGFLSELIGEDISKKELIIIEIQNSHELDYFLRILFGISKAITEYIKEGESYANIKKVISVNIIYFNLGQGADYVYKGTTNFKGIIADLYPEIYLIKVNQFDDVAKNTLDEWIYFFKNSEIKDSFKARGLKEANEKLRVANLPDDERKNYERYLDALRFNASMAETLKFEAKEKVRKNRSVEIAKQLKKKGVSNEIIVEATGLSIEEIEAL